jgi:hypothetical protein
MKYEAPKLVMLNDVVFGATCVPGVIDSASGLYCTDGDYNANAGCTQGGHYTRAICNNYGYYVINLSGLEL